MYADKYRYQIVEQEFSLDLCGKDRPGHFTGVLTVVMKLLNLALATRAYFGEKDFQQYKLIEGMLKSFFHPTQMIMGETIREENGLALSSRNRLLSVEDRSKAAKFNQILRAAATCAEAKALLESDGCIVDYVKELAGDFAGRRFAAVRLGGVRLIDNVKV
jgi:pantoate--beta-alanine ligase